MNMQVWNKEYKERLLSESKLWKNRESDRFYEEKTGTDFKLLKNSKMFVLYRGALEVLCANGTIEQIIHFVDMFVMWENSLNFSFEVCDYERQYDKIVKKLKEKNFEKVDERKGIELFFNPENEELVRVKKSY